MPCREDIGTCLSDAQVDTPEHSNSLHPDVGAGVVSGDIPRRLEGTMVDIRVLGVAILSAHVGCCAAAGPGLSWDSSSIEAGVWQPRLEWTTSSATSGLFSTRQSIRLMGDYRLGEIRLGAASLGQVRFTSGVWYGPRSLVLGGAPAWSRTLGPLNMGWSTMDTPIHAPEVFADAPSAWPYLGLGFTGLWLGGALGLNADLGLAAQNPGAANLGRLLDNARSLDGVLKDLRLTPTLRLGMSYRF